MYIPRANQEDRLPVLHKLMEDQPLASLVTLGAAGLFATHLPLVLESSDASLDAGFGVLRGHISRANIQWKDLSAEVQALAIFSGPHHYITPAWYEEKQTTGKVVPTWNYAVVHAYGYLKVIEDSEWLMTHLERLTGIHEADSSTPWKVSDAPADYIASMAKGIVGLEMVIDRLEGKWKVSQNRSEQDRLQIARKLEELGTSESLAMKALVEKRR